MMVVMAACKKDEDDKPEFISAQGPELVEFSNENPWISWDFDANGGSLTYNLYIGEVNPPDSLVADNITETTFQLRGLNYSTTYYYKIVASDGDGNQVESPVMSFTTRKMPDFMDAFTGEYTGMLIVRTRTDNEFSEDTADFSHRADITRIDNNTLIMVIEDLPSSEGDYLQGSDIPNYFKSTDTTHFYFYERDSVYCYKQTDPGLSYRYYGRKISK